MAFVKVVEGSEIYNFPIHHFVHFCSKFWRYSCSNRGTVKQNQVCRCHTAMSHARARRSASASAPAPPPEAAPSSRARAPRHLEVLLGRASLPSMPYQPGARHGPPAVRGTPSYVRWLRPPYHGCIFAVTPSSSPAEPPYLRPCFTLAGATIAIAATMTTA
jgi:hypothetical protein